MTSQATQEQLYEHLALLVRYFEQETSQGDGIAEEHFDGYMAAKSLLARLAPGQPSCENAISNSTGEMTCSTCGCDESLLRRRLDLLVGELELLHEVFTAAVTAFENRGKGGQNVPFFGDFASISPSTYKSIKRFASRIESVLSLQLPSSNDAMAMMKSGEE